MKHLAAGFETKKKIVVIYLKTIKSSAVNFYERKIFDRNLFRKPTGAVIPFCILRFSSNHNPI